MNKHSFVICDDYSLFKKEIAHYLGWLHLSTDMFAFDLSWEEHKNKGHEYIYNLPNNIEKFIAAEKSTLYCVYTTPCEIPSSMGKLIHLATARGYEIIEIDYYEETHECETRPLTTDDGAVWMIFDEFSGIQTQVIPPREYYTQRYFQSWIPPSKEVIARKTATEVALQKAKDRYIKANETHKDGPKYWWSNLLKISGVCYIGLSIEEQATIKNHPDWERSTTEDCWINKRLLNQGKW